MGNIELYLYIYMAILSRLTPLFFASNMTPFGKFPFSVRLITLFLISFIYMFPEVEKYSKLNLLFEFDKYILVTLLKELVLGLGLVFSFYIVGMVILIFGKMLDIQIGFSAAGVVDPGSNETNPLIGQIVLLTIICLFFSFNLHLRMIELIGVTFKLIPVGEWRGINGVNMMLSYVSSLMIMALMLFGPISLGIWLVDFANGFLGKSMPQMHVYFVMLPLKIGVGILLLLISFENVRPIVIRIFDLLLGWLNMDWAM